MVTNLSRLFSRNQRTMTRIIARHCGHFISPGKDCKKVVCSQSRDIWNFWSPEVKINSNSHPFLLTSMKVIFVMDLYSYIYSIVRIFLKALISFIICTVCSDTWFLKYSTKYRLYLNQFTTDTSFRSNIPVLFCPFFVDIWKVRFNIWGHWNFYLFDIWFPTLEYFDCYFSFLASLTDAPSWTSMWGSLI